VLRADVDASNYSIRELIPIVRPGVEETDRTASATPCTKL
jgi:hypothetical protein